MVQGVAPSGPSPTREGEGGHAPAPTAHEVQGASVGPPPTVHEVVFALPPTDHVLPAPSPTDHVVLPAPPPTYHGADHVAPPPASADHASAAPPRHGTMGAGHWTGGCNQTLPWSPPRALRYPLHSFPRIDRGYSHTIPLPLVPCCRRRRAALQGAGRQGVARGWAEDLQSHGFQHIHLKMHKM